MNILKRLFFSMESMGVLILMFAVAMGAATIIENDFDTATAQKLVYHAKWFETIILLLVINLVANIFRFKLYTCSKLSIFIFHLSFIITIVGSAITRYISYEGIMHIREGATQNSITSAKAYIMGRVMAQGDTINFEEQVLFTPYTKNVFSKSISINNQDVNFKLTRYIQNAAESVIEGSNGNSLIEIVVPNGKNMKSYFLDKGNILEAGGILFAFNNSTPNADLYFDYQNDSLTITPATLLLEMNMMGAIHDSIAIGKTITIKQKTIYVSNQKMFVLNNFYKSAKHTLVSTSTDDPNSSGLDALVIELTSGQEKHEILLKGRKGIVAQNEKTNINGIEIVLNYGSKPILLPFSLKLRDFQLDRYPGSMSPSSYASEVTLINKKENIEQDYRIFMNNVLNYGGYRFFQSSYDSDEKGTILSVNHDFIGTIVTYIGYLLMVLGMALALFMPNTRFRKLIAQTSDLRNKRKILVNKTVVKSLFLFLLPATIVAQNDTIQNITIDYTHARKFGAIMLQDHTGRIEPLNTFASEILRKLTRKNTFMGMHADQVFLSIILYPQQWQNIPLIKISDPNLKEQIGISKDTKYVAFSTLVDHNAQVYKLSNFIQTAHQKKPSEQTKFDKDVIAVDERVNIAYKMFNAEFLKIIPNSNNLESQWLTPSLSLSELPDEDEVAVKRWLTNYLTTLTLKQWDNADLYIDSIATYQNTIAASILPTQTKRNMEIRYNDMQIFKRIYYLYGMLGFVLLIVLFVDILRPNHNINKIMLWFGILIGLVFVFHTFGLGLRWYISGYAPWSNGYESMVYIAWTTILAGFIFIKRSPITLASTALLASITLMVAHLNWLDPEITQLVPVLKSYWLMIHVSIITASYGFLALGAILGFLILIIMIFQNIQNQERLNLTINEMSHVNELTLTVGLYMLTIGTFLGGVWANESWGRYWGWDPKETWALVTVLIYAFVVHMRLIKGARGVFAFNFMSVMAYFSVLMTYFGVNYYLSGLHSYAKGDPVPIPAFVYYTLAIIFIVAMTAYLKNQRINGRGN